MDIGHNQKLDACIVSYLNVTNIIFSSLMWRTKYSREVHIFININPYIYVADWVVFELASNSFEREYDYNYTSGAKKAAIITIVIQPVGLTSKARASGQVSVDWLWIALLSCLLHRQILTSFPTSRMPFCLSLIIWYIVFFRFFCFQGAHSEL